MSLPADLLQRPRRAALRLLLLERLDAARAAALRLEDPADAEALHAFRVALRRLRSLSQVWRHELKGLVRGRNRRGLRAVQAATGGGRDAEVALLWLEAQRDVLDASELPGLDWACERIRAEWEDAMAHAREGVREAFDIEDERLRRALSAPMSHGPRKKSFRKALRRRTREQAAALIEWLEGIHDAEDEEHLHGARIAAKRLRYILEPVRPLAPASVDVVHACKQLQDRLGDINDAHVQRRRLASLLETLDGPGGQDSLRPGLQALHRLAGERLRSLHAALVRDWLGDRGRRVRKPLEALIHQLSKPRGRKSKTS